VGLITLRAFKVEDDAFHAINKQQQSSDVVGGRAQNDEMNMFAKRPAKIPISTNSHGSTATIGDDDFDDNHKMNSKMKMREEEGTIASKGNNGCGYFLELFDLKVEESSSWAYLKVCSPISFFLIKCCALFFFFFFFFHASLF
jgi:hypothetical protein